MASDRHHLRSLIIQTLFAWEFRGGEAQELLTYNLANSSHKTKDSLFASQHLDGILKNRDAILEQITQYAPEWPLDKIAPIDRVILELGIYELTLASDIPEKVAINEAIELAKEFGTESSSKFVNGVLSSIYDDLKKKND